MSSLITTDDLATFLRLRKSDLCRIGADFVTDHPQHAQVQAATKLFYSLIKSFWRKYGLHGKTYWTRMLAHLGLRPLERRVPYDNKSYDGWLANEIAIYAPRWAARIIREIKPENE